ncbi:MAG: DUF1837 domain-containing protein [Burkholderiaceae bacterium]|nr:DUF1837 domain-containing protein [Burkholderiaceae bacterium]
MTPFFDIHCQQLRLVPTLRGVCAGFESGKWRSEQLSRYLMEWLPEFCLSHSERKSISDTNMVRQLREAAQTVYDTDKYDRRGEFGELILHSVLREAMGTDPAISKIYFKDAVNSTVKGFDAVHVLDTPTGLELWLGEVKFYTSATKAVDDVVKELKDHFQDDYLKKEFLLITRKLDPTWAGSARLRELLSPHATLDKLIKAIVVPVLLTYESSTTKSFTETCDEYVQRLESELTDIHTKFAGKNSVIDVRIELFLFPLANKQELLDHLHKRLVAAQDI